MDMTTMTRIQPRCGQPRADGQPCSTPVPLDNGMACGAHRQHKRASTAQALLRAAVAAGIPFDDDTVVEALVCTCPRCSLSEILAIIAPIARVAR